MDSKLSAIKYLDDTNSEPVSLGSDIKDISSSPAFIVLEKLEAEGVLSGGNTLLLKQEYSKLHEYLLDVYEREKVLLKKAKSLNQDFLTQRINLEKLSIKNVESSQIISNFEKERDRVSKIIINRSLKNQMH